MRSILTAFVLAGVLLGGCAPAAPGPVAPEAQKLLIFHNNSGPMCLEALDWLATMRSQHPGLVIEEHLTFEPGEMDLLNQMKAGFGGSQGVSPVFGFLPIVFFRGQAFSGFNDDIRDALAALIASAGGSSG